MKMSNPTSNPPETTTISTRTMARATTMAKETTGTVISKSTKKSNPTSIPTSKKTASTTSIVQPQKQSH